MTTRLSTRAVCFDNAGGQRNRAAKLRSIELMPHLTKMCRPPIAPTGPNRGNHGLGNAISMAKSPPSPLNIGKPIPKISAISFTPKHAPLQSRYSYRGEMFVIEIRMHHYQPYVNKIRVRQHSMFVPTTVKNPFLRVRNEGRTLNFKHSNKLHYYYYIEVIVIGYPTGRTRTDMKYSFTRNIR